MNQAGQAVRVQYVHTSGEVDALRSDWLRLHARDAQASIFMSWWWLRAWMDVSNYPWALLVARSGEDDQVIGLFPISPRGSRKPYRLDQLREIHTAGDPAADYRGFVLDPQHEDHAIAAFADWLARDRWWDRIVLKEILDDRLPQLLERLRAAAPQLHIDQSNGQPCPMLELPDSWESYLRECLTPPSRKSLKKRLRIAHEHGCRLTSLQDRGSHPARQLEALLALAGARGKSDAAHLARCRRIFESCIEVGCAEIFVLWSGATPIAAQGSFIDGHAGSLAHYLTGFDAGFAGLSPGRVLDALCIRAAIERGFGIVDFLRGDEPYKHQLGARPRFTRNAVVARAGLAPRIRSALSAMRDNLGI